MGVNQAFDTQVEGESPVLFVLGQTNAERDTATAEACCRIWRLSLLRTWRQHSEQRVGARDQRNRGQTVRVDALRTGNDDGVADLNIGN